MNENYKFFIVASAAVAALVSIVCFARAGWLDWTDDPVWVTAMATTVLAVGALIALRQLTEVRRDRSIQVLSDFGRRWDNEQITAARNLQTKYHSKQLAVTVELWLTNPASQPDVRVLLRVPSYFEDLAIMVELGKLDISYVRRTMGTNISRMWDYWEPAIRVLQRKDGDDAYVEFENLRNNLRRNDSAE